MASVSRGFTRTARIVLGALLLLGAAHAQAQTYDYGGGGGDFEGESGVLLVVEGILTNPRNTDYTDVKWDDKLAGRLGVGYQWANGNRLLGSIWSFDTTQANLTNTDEVQITARVGDMAFGKIHEPIERFQLEWSVGLRVATYEETDDGMTAKSEMLGAKTAVRATYGAGVFSVSSAVGFSFLDGELTGASGAKDDGRSGTITDFDVTAAWHARGDKIRLVFGWETAVWRGLAFSPDGSRDSVTFSGPKLGAQFVF